MPTLQLPSVVVRDADDCELILRLKAAMELEKRDTISMAELIRHSLKELAKVKGVAISN